MTIYYHDWNPKVIGEALEFFCSNSGDVHDKNLKSYLKVQYEDKLGTWSYRYCLFLILNYLHSFKIRLQC